jgi:hypothetical protein
MTDSGDADRPLGRLERAAGAAGLLFALLLTSSLLLFNTLPAVSDPNALVAWFDDVALRFRVAGYYLVPFSGVAFFWFMAAIRERASTRSDRFFDTIFLCSGAVFVGMLFAASSSTVSLLESPQIGAVFAPTDETIRAGRLSSFGFFYIFAARAAGVFTIVTSGMLLRSKLLPRWVGLLGLGVGLVLLLGMGFFRYFIYLFPMWVAVVSLVFIVVVGRDRSTAEPTEL